MWVSVGPVSRRSATRLTVILLSALVLFAPSFETHAQTSRVVKIGWLTTARHPFIESFREGLRELGYVEGKNLVIEERYGSPERLPELTFPPSMLILANQVIE